MKITLDIIGTLKAGKLINDILHGADVFEPGKRHVEIHLVEMRGKPNLDTICEKIARSFKEGGGFAVFVGIRGIDGQAPTKPYTYLQPGVQSLSITRGGRAKWCMFADCLRRLGYRVETKEDKTVTRVIGQKLKHPERQEI